MCVCVTTPEKVSFLSRERQRHRCFYNCEELEVPDRREKGLCGRYVFSNNHFVNVLLEFFCLSFLGTFKSSPRLWTQLYTVHGFVHGKMFPLIYALLVDKKKQTYAKLFRSIKRLAPGFEPEEVQLDFEMSAKNALEEVFPGVQTKGCLFHYGQSLWRKAQELGLSRSVRTIEEVSEYLRTTLWF